MWGARCAATAAALVVSVCGVSGASKPRELGPEVRLPLTELGFPGYAVTLLHAGASMATVNVLDDKHVMFTYSLRSLVPRLAGDDPNDDDREVEAEVVEVPNGKVLARTQWHLHDHARYLWSVGRGVFVLRSGADLSLFSPMRGLAAGDAFERVNLHHRPGRPVLLSGSADGKILTVELQSKEKKAEAGGDMTQPSPKHTTMEFFRIELPERSGPISVQPAGAVGAPGLMMMALDGDGYLWADDGSRSDWKVSFNEYAGKMQTLAEVHSSCAPHLHLLSRSEFAAISCAGLGDSSSMLATYGFDGHENWQEDFEEDLQPPTFVAAPEAGRFAISRLVAFGGGAPISGPGAEDETLQQEIRVYGTESGDMLLRVQCQPAMRSPENFDLSPDGRTLAVLGSKTLDLYRLPALTERDRKDLEDVRTMSPPLASGPVRLTRISRPIEPEEPEGETAAPNTRRLLTANGDAVPIPAAATTGAAVPAGGAAANGNGAAAQASAEKPVAQERVAAPAAVAPVSPASPAARADGGLVDGGTATGPRKPPTLLEPGESPEFKPPASTPQ